MDARSTITLNNGINMPFFGLGVYQIRSKNTVEIFKHAINLGYRLFDTASLYGNEKEVGKAIRESGISRDEFFVTTKLWNSDHGFEQTKSAFNRSLELLDIDWIDLYLIHWPVSNKRKDSWRALEELYESDYVRAIGVSNYMIHHLQELLSQCTIPPVINQIEFHPFLFRKDLLEFSHNENIQIEAYSPLTKGKRLDDPFLTKIASKYNKSVAQLLIRWCLQHKVVVIPKSSNSSRLKENINVFDFEITSDDMEKLDKLDTRIITSWDPSEIP